MKQQFDALVEHLLGANIFLGQAIELLERRMIEGALERSGGKHVEASKRLGIHRNTLQRKVEEYNLETGRRPRRRPAARAGRIQKRQSGVA
jgi:DNA-binding NtrC family response regulator